MEAKATVIWKNVIKAWVFETWVCNLSATLNTILSRPDDREGTWGTCPPPSGKIIFLTIKIANFVYAPPVAELPPLLWCLLFAMKLRIKWHSSGCSCSMCYWYSCQMCVGCVYVWGTTDVRVVCTADIYVRRRLIRFMFVVVTYVRRSTGWCLYARHSAGCLYVCYFTGWG